MVATRRHSVLRCFGIDRSRSASGQSRRWGRGGQAGFTMVEVLVAVVVLAILLTLTLPNFFAMQARRSLQGAAEQAVGLMAKARYDAIRYSQPRAVTIDPASRALFIDLDADGALDPREELEGAVRLARGVDCGGPAADADATAGFTDVGGIGRAAIFEPTGSLRSGGGAFRLRDEHGNFLEVRVDDPATARVVLRKWQDGAWWERGEGGERWTWQR